MWLLFRCAASYSSDLPHTTTLECVLLVPVVAYFDASGQSDDPSIAALFVSGFVSSEAKWRKWVTEWDGLLADFGLTRPFRTSKFWADWRDEPKEREAFFFRAIKLLKLRTFKSFSSGVHLPAYEKAAGQWKLPLWVGDPYALCAATVVAKVDRWYHRQSKSMEIAYAFELGDKGRGKFLTALEEAGINTALRPNFLPKANLPPFDAADMLAWLHARTIRQVSQERPTDVKNIIIELETQLPGSKDAWGWHDWAWFEKHQGKWTPYEDDAPS